MSVICNICIDDTDLDIILSKISTLKTKIADWVDHQKIQGLLGRMGLQSDLCAKIELCNIEIDNTPTLANIDEEIINSLINDINDLFDSINE